jgi:hypothetical protein
MTPWRGWATLALHTARGAHAAAREETHGDLDARPVAPPRARPCLDLRCGRYADQPARECARRARRGPRGSRRLPDPPPARVRDARARRAEDRRGLHAGQLAARGARGAVHRRRRQGPRDHGRPGVRVGRRRARRADAARDVRDAPGRRAARARGLGRRASGRRSRLHARAGRHRAAALLVGHDRPAQGRRAVAPGDGALAHQRRVAGVGLRSGGAREPERAAGVPHRRRRRRTDDARVRRAQRDDARLRPEGRARRDRARTRSWCRR